MSDKSRLSGHSLVSEGAPHDAAGRRLYGLFGGTGGGGYGKCTCGAMSDALPSAHKRKQWHREHKAEMRRDPQPVHPAGDGEHVHVCATCGQTHNGHGWVAP